jgi:hypothetical protein
MKKTIWVAAVLAAELLASQILQAQGSLYVSNLGQTSTGSMGIGSNSWIAQPFFTGTDPNDYSLNSIQLLMNAASGSPSNFTVSIFSHTADGTPGSNLGSLTGSDPAAGGIFTYADRKSVV